MHQHSSRSGGRGPRRSHHYSNRQSHGQRFGQSRPHFGQRRSHHSRPVRGTSIHYSKFINRATEPQRQEKFVPDHAFADFQIDERLKNNIAKKGYVHPTPIQDKAIPVVLQGSDIVGIANTGTGKTGAFLIPLIDKVLKNRDEKVLIMVPTRELAVQIADEFKGFTPGLGLHAAVAVGGANINMQIRDIRLSPQFLIATPGRLMDLMERNAVSLAKCHTVVLDEADRMLDMGFIKAMEYIMGTMPAERHTLFFSATLSNDIEKLIGSFLNNPVRISVKTGDTSKNVDQDVVKIAPGRTKVDHLHELLGQPELSKVIVFGRTKHGVEKLTTMLRKMGHEAESIHGNKSQNQRLRALDLFKKEKIRVLVATDVAARGLDIPKVSHVINFDVPQSYDDYVHRIGRTGRAGEVGKALTFID